MEDHQNSIQVSSSGMRYLLLLASRQFQILGLAIVSVLLVTACVTTNNAPVATITASYNAAEYAPYRKPGSGKVVGQAFLKTVGGDVKYGAGDNVALMPVTSLTSDVWNKLVLQNLPVQNLLATPHVLDCGRKAVGDGEGHFEFDNLPPGEYYLYCVILWGVPGESGVQSTGGIAYAKVSVRNGKTTRAIVTR